MVGDHVREARGGLAEREASISRSQPSESIGTGTGRAPTARTASSAAA